MSSARWRRLTQARAPGWFIPSERTSRTNVDWLNPVSGSGASEIGATFRAPSRDRGLERELRGPSSQPGRQPYRGFEDDCIALPPVYRIGLRPFTRARPRCQRCASGLPSRLADGDRNRLSGSQRNDEVRVEPEPAPLPSR